jgi:hypothetical protein
MAGTALIGICLMRDTIRKVLLNRKERLIYIGLTVVPLLLICSPYIISTWRVPLASNNVYEQQFQMHRFVNDFYRAPVAVNDLGLVSYHNPNFVFDLVGLASEKARILRSRHADADTYREFVNANDIHLVIIYDEWYQNEVPGSWSKVASMDLSRQRVSADHSEVQFYATDAATASKLRPELLSFSRGLPPGVKLTIYSPIQDAVHTLAGSGPQ